MIVGWPPKWDSLPAGLTLVLGSEVDELDHFVCVRLNSVTVLKQVYCFMVDYLGFLFVLVAFD